MRQTLAVTGGHVDPIARLRPRRRITGMSAVLLPFTDAGAIDWASFRTLLGRTVDAGLTPAVNMDTGYVNLLTPAERFAVLDATKDALGGTAFVAGAFVDDTAADPFDLDAYAAACDAIAAAGGTPVIFPSYGLTSLRGDDLFGAYRAIASRTDRFIAFELGSMFAPFGRIFDLDEVRGLMGIDGCIGMKHSSLRRQLEWDRLDVRDATRPDFTIFTGNDLAIDMVMYGSDYLLGLSAFAPDAFAARDAAWADGDPRFYELNDVLQYLGAFAFRDPVPAYKHTAAQFLCARGWIASNATHPRAACRPSSDVAVLERLLARLEAELGA
jgi:dihydrodipicolinate synthase/N-acetylneuraminate lyase